MELNFNYEELELFDGVDFTTLFLESVDENNFLHYYYAKEGKNLKEESAPLFQDRKGDYFIFMDFPYLYTDICKVRILKDKVDRIKNAMRD